MNHKNANTYCNNCSKLGHAFYHCKGPIASHGIIVFRYNPFSTTIRSSAVEYLMIRRKDTFGFIHFIRGKYSVHNKMYLLNIIGQMTVEEKRRILVDRDAPLLSIKHQFDQLWDELWSRTDRTDIGPDNKPDAEKITAREKFVELSRGCFKKDGYSLASLIEESNQRHPPWKEAEWGFPKGRRNQNEKEFACALREFSEETGYYPESITVIENMVPFEEMTMGSNYKSYKNKYYLAYMDYAVSLQIHKEQICEVSACEWKSYDAAVQCIREYNREKLNMLQQVHATISSLVFVA